MAASPSSSSSLLQTSSPQQRKISYDVLYSKVLGAWLAKTIGGTIGAPFEVHKLLGNDVTKENCWPSEIIPNDDLDIQILWLEAMEERGMWFTQQDLGELWAERCWYNFAEYSFFLNNQRRGIHAPVSGSFNNEFYRESMGCPIRSEIWGIVALGNPGLAAEFARMDGELDHINESVWCEQFWAAAQAEAFFCDSIEKVFEAGRAVIPEDCRIMEISRTLPQMWKSTPNPDILWRRLNREYGNRDGSKVCMNFALQLLALHAAPDDFEKLMVESARYGYDVDSTAATVGALIGILRGAAALPKDWVARLGNRLCCGINVKHRYATFEEMTRDTLKVTVEMCETRNSAVRITNVPDDIRLEVNERRQGRNPRAAISITAEYPNGPGLYSDRSTPLTLCFNNRCDEVQQGVVNLHTSTAILLSETSKKLLVPPRSVAKITVNLEQDSAAGLLHDKNLFTATWSGEETVSRDFGVAGARQYKVYGPYWDVYDTSEHLENPFRRPGYRCHPLQVPGIPLTRVHVHNFARLDRPYLDETALLKGDLPSEDPYIVQCPEDYVTNERLGGFVGEACYYLVREIVAPCELRCTLSCGSTNPFVIWVDGEEKIRSEECDTWGFQEHTTDLVLKTTPTRFVIKVAKRVEEFRLMLSFMRKEFPQDGSGLSVFHDELADKVV